LSTVESADICNNEGEQGTVSGMSGAQKVSISLLISVLVFSVLAVLVAVDRFRVLETAFYVPRVEESIRERAKQTADLSDAFHDRNLTRYSQFVLEDAIRAAFRINASSAQIQERRERLDALEAEQASLDRIRIVDLDATQLHYSSDPGDYVEGGTQRTYLRPDEVSEDEGVPLGELAFFEDISDDFELPGAAEIPARDIYLNPEANQFIYRLPVLDTSGILQGAALFYVNVLDLSTLLIRNGLIGTGDQVRVVNENGLVVRVPAQVAETLTQTVRSEWTTIAVSEDRVSLVSEPETENPLTENPLRRPTDDPVGVLRYEAFAVEPSLNGTLVYLEPSSSLEMPLPLQYTLIGAVFLTTFLVAFLILNVRQDAVVVLRDRVKRFQVNLLREYMEAKEEIDFERWRAELEDRRDEVSKQVRRGLGRLKADEKKEVDDLIDRTWDEIIDVLSSRAQSSPVRGGEIGRIEEIVDQLTRKLATTPLNVQSVPEAHPPGSDAPPAAPRPVGVEEVESLADGDDIQELGDADEVEEIVGLDEADEAEDVDEVDEVSELDEVEEVDELQDVADGAGVAEDYGTDPSPETSEAQGVQVDPESIRPDEFDEGSGERRPVDFPAGFKPGSVTFETLNEHAELEWLAANESDVDETGYQASSAVVGPKPPHLKLVSVDEDASSQDEPSTADTEGTSGSPDSVDEVEELEMLGADEDELQPVEAEALEGRGSFDVSESRADDEEAEWLLEPEDASDADLLEELQSEESDEEPRVPDELPVATHASTTFGAGLFGFGRGTEVRLPRRLQPVRVTSENDQEQERGETGRELDQEGEPVAELANLEPVASARTGRARGESGVVRISHDRAISTADYEIADIGDILGRLHISKSILLEEDGVFQIDRSAYQAPVATTDQDVHSLIRDVTGGQDAEHTPGVEELFGGPAEDELSEFASPAGPRGDSEERIGISVFRFTDQGFDYDGFLRGYKRNDSGLLKSMVSFTRYWNARVGIIFQPRENEHEPYAAIGIDDRCRSSMVISKSSSVARNTLNQGRVLFIKRPLTEVEYFKDMCSPQSLAFFERSLFLPMVLAGQRVYFLLGLRGAVDSLDDAFRTVLPILRSSTSVVGSSG